MNAEMIEQKTIEKLHDDLAIANGCINELKSKVNKLKYYNESQDRFWQAFCAALGGLVPNDIDCTQYGVAVNVKYAIMHAQEAVRQVGAMATSSNLDAVEPSGNTGELYQVKEIALAESKKIDGIKEILDKVESDQLMPRDALSSIRCIVRGASA